MRILLLFNFFCCAVIGFLCEDIGPIQLLDFESNDNKTVLLKQGSIEKLFLDPLILNRDVVVVSIAGAFRKGKSFLLNYMLRYLYANFKSVSNPEKIINETEALNWLGKPDEPLRGFSWKSSTKRDTTGIIFWSDVFIYDSPSGDKLAIYLMDTQGLFDHSSTPTENIRIFSLSALISSVQLMNIYSMIEESHLEYLQFATAIARFTAVETNSDSKPFQKLMFLIRDWNQPEEYSYGIEGGNRFLKKFLSIKNFHTAELKQVREYIKDTFEDISCFLMPYPGKAVARNSSFDGRWSEIDEEFFDAMKELLPLILTPEKLIKKSINGVAIKAFEISIYIKQYVDQFKSENLPEAKSIYESTVDNQFQILMSKSVEVYLKMISDYQDRIKNVSDVDKAHKVAKTLASRFFEDQKKFGNSEEGLMYQKELEEKLEIAFNEWKPARLEFLEKMKDEEAKADEQRVLASAAENRELIARHEARVADKDYLEIQEQIRKARYDTEESRKEIEILKNRLALAERERQDSLLREQEARKYLAEMKKMREFYEMQIRIEKEKTDQKIKEHVISVRQREGIPSLFSNAANKIVDFFASIFNN